ncbi:alpha/beta hydrolase [Paenibacillus gansuensis]|uniref:Alpha/beta hydrolase n=1 Tax=Paenibacillus gansuensis TaxID=306542 RepID=A0ABW5P7C8_9BACL
MIHLFEKGSDPSAPTLVLFHGTGGNEHQMVPLAKEFSPGSSVLSLRGNVLENGMPRFFRRLAEGVFDEADLIFRTQEVKDFLDQAAVEHGFDRDNLVAVGYSNGANIIGSLLFHHEGVLKGAILHHPMVPRRGVAIPELKGLPVFIGAGTNDPICPRPETEELTGLLSDAGADVMLHWESFGHQLTNSEIDTAVQWFRKNFA